MLLECPATRPAQLRPGARALADEALVWRAAGRRERRMIGGRAPPGNQRDGRPTGGVRIPASASAAISVAVRPASASTSSVCSPGSGAGLRTAAGVEENLAAGGMTLY